MRSKSDLSLRFFDSRSLTDDLAISTRRRSIRSRRSTRAPGCRWYKAPNGARFLWGRSVAGSRHRARRRRGFFGISMAADACCPLASSPAETAYFAKTPKANAPRGSKFLPPREKSLHDTSRAIGRVGKNALATIPTIQGRCPRPALHERPTAHPKGGTHTQNSPSTRALATCGLVEGTGTQFAFHCRLHHLQGSASRSGAPSEKGKKRDFCRSSTRSRCGNRWPVHVSWLSTMYTQLMAAFDACRWKDACGRWSARNRASSRRERKGGDPRDDRSRWGRAITGRIRSTFE